MKHSHVVGLFKAKRRFRKVLTKRNYIFPNLSEADSKKILQISIGTYDPLIKVMAKTTLKRMKDMVPNVAVRKAFVLRKLELCG